MAGFRGRNLVAALACAVTVGLLGAAPTAAAPSPGKRIERPVRSTAPDAKVVKESYVRIYRPLPASAGAHPAACDWIGYLRFRHRDGPAKAPRADAIFVAMPGFLAGASTFDQLARNLVRDAGRRGRHFELWAIDRRSNCLEDDWGVRQTARNGNVRRAFDYYFGGQAVGGRRFGGFKSGGDASFLSAVGLGQTLRDWSAVIRRGVPKRLRSRKVFCGGHSLGGPLTAAFAGWDFDGNPETKADAGFHQCAGFFGLDTGFGIDGSGGQSGFGVGPALATASGASPFVDAPPVTPESLQTLSVIGLAGYRQPNRESIIPQLIPRTPEFELTLRLLFARNAVEFATGTPSVRDFRVTNAAQVGAIFDDNSSPISIFRASIGTFDGGPVVEKDFPTPNELSQFPAFSGAGGGLVGGSLLMAPSTPHGPLYGWRRWDRMTAPGAPVQLSDSGQPFTSAASEVSDVRQLARALFEAPANFVEQYFPLRILTDVNSAENGDRGGELENLRYDGVARRPHLLIQAANGIGGEDGESPARRRGRVPGGVVTLPGYDHLDVATAAHRQNGGRPEGSSRTLLRFALKVLARRR